MKIPERFDKLAISIVVELEDENGDSTEPDNLPSLSHLVCLPQSALDGEEDGLQVEGKLFTQ